VTTRSSAGLYALGAVVFSSVVLSVGSTVVVKSGSSGVVVTFWRMWAASLIWFMIVRSSGIGPHRQALRTAAPIGVIYGLNLVLFFTAVTKTRVANAEFIGTLTPLLILPFAARRLHERVSRTVIGLGALALLGVALVLFNAPQQRGANNWTGNILAFVGVITWTAYLLLSRVARSTLDTRNLMFGLTLVAAVVVTPIALVTSDIFRVSAIGWAMIAVSTIGNGIVAHSIISWSQNRVAVSTISMIQLSQPGMAAFWAWLFLGQTIRPLQGLGMVIMMIAVGAIAAEAARQHLETSRIDAAAVP
jgi:drug/metabolite transporter (DMT)-like permease